MRERTPEERDAEWRKLEARVHALETQRFPTSQQTHALIPCWIAAPYADYDHAAGVLAKVEKNVSDAVAFAFRYTSANYAPICIHPAIQAGAYGNDGDDSDRAQGLAVSRALVRLIASDPLGVFVLLLRRDGTISPGCLFELCVFLGACGEPASLRYTPNRIHVYAYKAVIETAFVRLAPDAVVSLLRTVHS